jgi:hypothetical protein
MSLVVEPAALVFNRMGRCLRRQLATAKVSKSNFQSKQRGPTFEPWCAHQAFKRLAI